MVNPPLLDQVLESLDQMSMVRAVTLFGSHARSAADLDSDIDLQVITRAPKCFHSPAWLTSVSDHVIAYALRPAFGGVVKATAVFSQAEVDVVVLPLARLRLARWLVALGVHRHSWAFRRSLANLAIVLRPGHVLLRGDTRWETFFNRVLAEVPDPRVDDNDVRRMGDCAFADYVSVQRKIRRGELLAAQRWIHVHLVDTNLKLMHEYALRTGRRSDHDGRRVEQLRADDEQALLRTSAHPVVTELTAAAVHAITTAHVLVTRLTGRPPSWPRPTNGNGSF